MTAALLPALLLLSAATQPLPLELEQRLALARALPAPYSAAVILALIPSAKLSPEQIVPLAEEAYQLAGREAAIAFRAWIIYRDNLEDEAARALAMPVRPESLLATCADLEVPDPGDYYRWALQAGDREFRAATRNLRSAVETGRLAEALLGTGWEEYTPLLVRALAGNSGSDREFVEAMRFTGLHNAVLEIASRLTVAAGRTLLNEYRAFLVRHLSARRCAGNRGEEFEGVITEFNRLARRRGVTLLDPEIAKVQAVDTTARDLLPTANALLHKLTNAAADETGVRSMLTELERFRLEQKPGTNASTESTKAYLYGRFAERLAGTRFEARVMEEWLRFLAGSRLRDEQPRVWFRSARALSEWAGKDLRRQHLVESAGDPALAAYVRLTALLPESEVTRVLP